jgi:hypothetical protein
MTASGTTRTCRHVRSTSAIGGKPDGQRTSAGGPLSIHCVIQLPGGEPDSAEFHGSVTQKPHSPGRDKAYNCKVLRAE